MAFAFLGFSYKNQSECRGNSHTPKIKIKIKMSDHIPLDTQEQTLKRLPLKSVVQFRTVSKEWKSSIESSNFISGFGAHHTQPHLLLLRYRNMGENYLSFVDDDNAGFIRQDFAPLVSVLVNQLDDAIVVGSSHGLLCFNGHPIEDETRHMVVLWNPSIRKSVGVTVPGVLDRINDDMALGFGVCPATSDPTLVKITYDNPISWQVQVFTLSSGIWRILPGNLPRGSIAVTWHQVVIDRFIYWIAYDRIVDLNGGATETKLIISFDMINQQFQVIDLPDILSRGQGSNFYISKQNGSLVVVVDKHDSNWEIWLRNEATQLFEMSFTINIPDGSINSVLGFRRNGEAILETEVDPLELSAELELYNRHTQVFHKLGIHGEVDSFFVTSYMETLLLLNYEDGFTFA